MNVELTEHSPVKKTLSIEAGPEEIERETREVVRQYGKQAKLPGFRPGKAPADVIRKRFQKEIDEEVRDRMISRLFREAAREKGLRPLGEPVVDELEFDQGRPLRFKTTFEVLPAIEVRGHTGVEVLRPPVKLADAEIDQALQELRQSRVRLVVEEGREAQQGDVVVMDVGGTPPDAEPFQQEGVALEVGAEGNLPAFNEQLAGAKAADELSFSIDYPDEYPAKELAGKTVPMAVHVKEVKRRELPDLDDEFAKDLGEFDDLAALRERVREDLQTRKQQEEERGQRQAVLDQVLLANPVVLPDVLVDNEVRARLEDMARSMIMQGMDPQKAEVDWVALRKRQDEPARKTVHARLILDAVAEVEKITVERADVERRIQQDAERLRETADNLRKRLKQGEGMEALKTQMVREKTLDYLTSVANIQSPE